MWWRLGAAIVVFVLAACAPGSPQAEEIVSSSFGWSLSGDLGLDGRCAADAAKDPDDECRKAAEETLLVVLQNLGAMYVGPGIERARREARDARLEPDPAVEVTYERDPPFEWHTVDGARGRASVIAIDLEAFVRGTGDAYAVLESAGGAVIRRVVLPDEMAQRLLDAIFVRTR